MNDIRTVARILTAIANLNDEVCNLSFNEATEISTTITSIDPDAGSVFDAVSSLLIGECETEPTPTITDDVQLGEETITSTTTATYDFDSSDTMLVDEWMVTDTEETARCVVFKGIICPPVIKRASMITDVIDVDASEIEANWRHYSDSNLWFSRGGAAAIYFRGRMFVLRNGLASVGSKIVNRPGGVGSAITVAIAVAELFGIRKPVNAGCIRYIDGNKLNCAASNLTYEPMRTRAYFRCSKSDAKLIATTLVWCRGDIEATRKCLAASGRTDVTSNAISRVRRKDIHPDVTSEIFKWDGTNVIPVRTEVIV